MGADVTSTQYHGGQQGRLTYGRHKFFIQASIEVIQTTGNILVYITTSRGWELSSQIFDPKKFHLMPQIGFGRF
jgi:hypothetical protein